ncbi:MULTISPECIES: DUF6443 domain-containing protein [Sphingobacterium]|uniref:DUF6443 domain-containing protein n=1 Tax=Sphingobacterium TaxID=28453 RepID=UPI00257E9D1E|nr:MULTISPECIES: DUF6443 domain-containing protein [Sphingobacterium]
MRISLQYKFTVALLYLAGSLQAQPVAPASNIPIVEPVQPNPSFLYLGLENITGQTKFNYIQTQVPDQPIQAWPSVINNTRFRQVTDYFDGLGRPLQSVNMRAHQDGYDIVKHNVYDALGKTKFDYLPFAVPASMVPTQNGKIKLDANDKLRAFYDQAAPDEPPYSVNIDDDSPLGRMMKTMAPGIAWVGNNRGKTNYYRTNNAIEEVRIWTIGDANTDFPKSDYYFATDQLDVTESTDEDGKKQRTYTDKFGRVVLTRSLMTSSPGAGHTGFANTYYVYDKAGRLRFVIPPKAVDLMNTAGNWNASAVPDLLFSYFYDKKGRAVEKKIPGKALEEYVYDDRDRLIFSRDGNQRQNGQWAFTIYDTRNRPVVGGLGAFTSPRDVLQGLVDDPAVQYPAPDMWGYIKDYNLYNNYPTQINGATILSYTYYDNYQNASGIGYQYNRFNGQLPPASRPELVPVAQVASTMTRDLVTGSKIAVLDPETNQVTAWLNTVNFYDDNGRMIQTIKENLNGGREITSNIYYFQGMLWRTIRHHENANAEPIPGANDGAITVFDVAKTYERNIGLAGGNDAVKKITQSINGGALYNLVDFNYDHLGRNTTKSMNIGVVLNEYNMRGFLNHINAEDRTSYPFKPIFEEKLYYDTGFASKLYNGNITGIIWNGSDGEKRAYGYSYDLINRLTHAEFRLKSANMWKNVVKDYTVSNIKYDLNGNLNAMIQKGWDPTTNAIVNMDKLTYAYAPASNRLIKVQDDGVASSLPDFKDGANVATEYFYDPNGNMIKDLNKNISDIKYNHLNKPVQINVTGQGKINYFYDASGSLLRKVISGNSNATYDYFGEFVYKDNVLQYIVNEEGRARPIANDTSNNQTRFVYDYFVKDHLGNVRSTVTAAPISRDYMARHEIATANSEQLVFDNIPSVRDGKPVSTNPEDVKAAHLVAEDPNMRIGTAIMLKVMPGDKFTINAESYYEGIVKDNPTVSGADLVASLMGALMGGSTYTGIPVSELPENLATVKRILSNPELATVMDQVPVINQNPEAPKAHLNYMFFDDNMQLVPGLSGKFQVPVNNGGGWQVVDPGNICNCTPAGPGTSGWVVIYVDNQTIGKDVWFDNIHIEHYNSKVLEENHYYPHGLTLNTMSTGQSNLPGQPYKYNGKELEKTYGLEMYDYGARMYDPQLGVWHAPDPMAEKFAYESPFVYAGNNPVRNIDLGGNLKLQYNAEELRTMGVSRSQIETFRTIVNNVGNLLNNNPLALEAIVNTTGFTAEKIINDLRPGEGPIVEFSLTGDGGAASSDRFVISPKDIQYLQNIDPANREAYNQQLLGIGLTLLHEYGHHGDKVTNDGNNTGQYITKFQERKIGNKTERNYDSDRIGGKNKKTGKQGYKTSLTGHRGTDIEVVGFGVEVRYNYGQNVILPNAKYSETTSTENLPTPPSELPENVRGDNIRQTLLNTQ